MIKLEVENYCHDCVGFEADVENGAEYYAMGTKIVLRTDTIIRCEHRHRCEGIYKQLKEELSKNEG